MCRVGVSSAWNWRAGFVFWLSPLSVGQGKKLGMLSLVLETVSIGSVVSAKQKLCQDRAPQRQRLSECIQEPPSFLTFPSRPALSLHWPCPGSCLVEKQFKCGFSFVRLCVFVSVRVSLTQEGIKEPLTQRGEVQWTAWSGSLRI